MDLHQFVAAAETAGYLITIDREVDPCLEAARLAAEVDGRPVLFRRVKGSPFPVVAGICSDRRYFGLALGVPADQVMFRLAEALDAALTPPPLAEHPERRGRAVPATQSKGAALTDNRSAPFGSGLSPSAQGAPLGHSDAVRRLAGHDNSAQGAPLGHSDAVRRPAGHDNSAQDACDLAAEVAPCQEVVEPEVNLVALPFLTHYAGDAGPYASAAVAFIDDPETGPNASYHRLLRLDRTRVAARLVERRGAETAWRKHALSHAEESGPGGLPVAICIGLPPHVLLAASMAPPPGVDELSIAQALAPTPVVTCANGIRVPAAAEFVLEGRITHELVPEGPFVDLTGTYDLTRMQPVIEIDRVTHRRDPFYQALLPGKLEHRLLMGMPREPTIYAEVNKVARCLNVHITPGGASWLHAVVQIVKQAPDDGLRAIEAAFRGHSSLKHVWVVDDDVDIYDPNDVEWAVATRFQAERDLVVLRDQPSSSLDPSAQHIPNQKSRTAKMGLDATMWWDTPAGPREPEAFRRIG